MNHRIFTILGFATFILAFLTLSNSCFHWSALHAESNYWRAMQRLEGLFTAKRVGVVLVGSSIASHLYLEKFDGGKLGFVNLGFDGMVISSALTVLEREKVTPQLILVEASHITLSPKSDNDELVLKQQNTFNRWLWRICPAFRPTSRPSSILYSAFKVMKEKPATEEWLVKQHLAGAQCVEVVSWPSKSVDDDMHRAITNNPVVISLQNWQEKGVKVIFVKIPMGKTQGPSKDIYQVAQYLKSSIIDLGKVAELKGTVMHYTDGLHLDRASSEVCSLWLAEIVEAIFFDDSCKL